MYVYKYKKSFLLNEGGYRDGKLWKTSGTRGCIPHPYIFVQLLQDSEAWETLSRVYSYASLLMPHCPVTVVQRYRDGVCSLLFHSFFIIYHPYIPLHLEEMIFYTCFTHFLTVPNAPSKTMLEYRCKKRCWYFVNAARGDRTRTAPLQRYATNLYAMLHSPVISRE